jgi:bifunctional polynucleotide phosphatase/kinase
MEYFTKHEKCVLYKKGKFKYIKKKDDIFKLKIAAFDFDYTLFRPIKNRFPKDENDFTILFDCIKDRLFELVEKNFTIVIFTNQKRFNKKDKLKMVIKRIVNAFKSINLLDRVYIYAAIKDDNYRKPNIGCFDLFHSSHKFIPIDFEQSFFVGDAAGRFDNWKHGIKKDFSCADRKFAHNLKLKFYTPEEYFLDEESSNKYYIKTFEEFKNCQNNSCLINKINGNSNKNQKPEIVLMIGYPACGKSSFTKKKYNNYKIINQDTLKTKAKCLKMFKLYLKQTNNIVIDNLNQDIKTRKEYIDLAKEKDYFIKCYYFNIGLDISKHLNNLRMKLFNKEKIPEIVYRIFNKKFEYPSLNEGFNEVDEVLFSPDFIDEKHKKEFFMLS